MSQVPLKFVDLFLRVAGAFFLKRLFILLYTFLEGGDARLKSVVDLARVISTLCGPAFLAAMVVTLPGVSLAAAGKLTRGPRGDH